MNTTPTPTTQQQFAQGYRLVEKLLHNDLIRARAWQLCRRSDFSSSDYDDLRQAMLLHLIRTTHLYDPARGTPTAFAEVVLANWSAQHLRDRSRLKRSLHRTRSIEELGEAPSIDRRWRPATPVPQRAHERDMYRRCLLALSPQQLRLLADAALRGERWTARAHGLSRRQVRNELEAIRAACRIFSDAPENPDHS